MTRTIRSQFLFDAGLEPQEIVEEKDNLNYDDGDRQDFYQEQVSHVDAAPAGQAFVKGQLVSHKKFGTGRIKEFHNLGADSIVVVEFRNGCVKPLMLKYANLSVIE